MIIDVHTHIFPSQIREQRQKYVEQEPAFGHLYGSALARMVGARQIVTTMDEQGVDQSVIFGFPWRNPETARQHNDYIIEAVQRFPKRLMGFVCVDPNDDGAAKEVARCLAAGLSGVGELAFYESGIDQAASDGLEPIMAVARAHSVAVMIHTNEPVGHQYPGKTENTLVQIYNLVKRYHQNSIILAHLGGGLFFYNLLKKEVRQAFEKVYFDTAAAPFLYQPEVYRTAIDIIGPDKILFGSDYPLIPPKRYFKEMRQAGLTQDEFEAICGKNTRQLLLTK